MSAMLLTAAADSALGRLDHASLPQQAQMEILIDGLTYTSKQKFTDSHGAYLDIGEWPHVHANSMGQITRVLWSGFDITGTLRLESLPESLLWLDLSLNAVHGTLDAAQLPRNLSVLSFRRAALEGNLNIADLPRTLTSLKLESCGLRGTLDFTVLPQKLSYLNIRNNDFNGEIDVTKLPETLTTLDLRRNNFVGSPDLTSLPPTMSFLLLSGNKLSSVVRIVVRESLLINLSNNQIEKIVDENGHTVTHANVAY